MRLEELPKMYGPETMSLMDRALEQAWRELKRRGNVVDANAAFLGDLTPEQCRVLGFGDKGRLQLCHERSPRFPVLHSAAAAANTLGLRISDVSSRASSKLQKLFGMGA